MNNEDDIEKKIQNHLKGKKPIFLSPQVCEELGIAYNPHDLEDVGTFGMCLRITESEIEDEGQTD